MKRTNWQYLVDTLLFISVIGLVVIGFLLAFVIPKGPVASESAKYFLGLHRHGWGDIHLYLGITFTAMTVLHLILGWSWIKGKTRQIFGDRWKAALISAPVVALAFLIAFWAFLAAYPDPYEALGRPAMARQEGATPIVHETPLTDGEVLITGQMSLNDVERLTGISAQAVARRLGFSSAVSLDEPLGRLRRTYAFTLHDVRDAVSDITSFTLQ
jgi:hypothetical protein